MDDLTKNHFNNRPVKRVDRPHAIKAYDTSTRQIMCHCGVETTEIGYRQHLRSVGRKPKYSLYD